MAVSFVALIFLGVMALLFLGFAILVVCLIANKKTRGLGIALLIVPLLLVALGAVVLLSTFCFWGHSSRVETQMAHQAAVRATMHEGAMQGPYSIEIEMTPRHAIPLQGPPPRIVMEDAALAEQQREALERHEAMIVEIDELKARNARLLEQLAALRGQEQTTEPEAMGPSLEEPASAADSPDDSRAVESHADDPAPPTAETTETVQTVDDAGNDAGNDATDASGDDTADASAESDPSARPSEAPAESEPPIIGHMDADLAPEEHAPTAPPTDSTDKTVLETGDEATAVDEAATAEEAAPVDTAALTVNTPAEETMAPTPEPAEVAPTPDRPRQEVIAGGAPAPLGESLVLVSSRRGPATPNIPRPEWVDRQPFVDQDAYLWPVRTTPQPTVDDCLVELPRGLQAAVIEYGKKRFGSEAATRLNLPEGFLLDQFVRDNWVEPVDTSFGTWYQLHALVRFDDAANQALETRLREHLILERLTMVGGIALLTLFLLSMAYWFIRAAQNAPGSRGWRLRAAIVVGILVGVVVAAILARWLHGVPMA